VSVVFTSRELDLMAVLWDHGPSTVAEVREQLGDGVSHNTVATLLSILEKKGYVDHAEEGKAFRYRALVDRDEAGRSAISRVVDTIFGGSAHALITHFVRDRRLSDDEVREIRALLDRRPARKSKPRKAVKKTHTRRGRA
jgi:predicted transcriptional regulator